MKRIRMAVPALLAAAVVAAPAAPATADSPAAPGWSSSMTIQVGGVWIGELPAGMGVAQPFESEGDDGEQISTTVWESQTPEGYRVDASITVVRAPWLQEPQPAFEWLRDWQERPVEEADYRRITLADGRPAWLSADQVVWLVEPGVVASVRLAPDRFDVGLLPRIAASA